MARQPRLVVLQRGAAGRFGVAAPFLQVAQSFTGVVAAGLEQRRQARAVFDQGADARARLHPLLQLPACVGLEPAAVVGDALAQLARQQRTQLRAGDAGLLRSEEHTSELQSLMRISYAVFCLKKQKKYT